MKTFFSKITAALLVVMMLFSIVPVMGLELSSQAAEKVTFSLNFASETSSQVVLTVKLDSGSFGAVDFGVTYNATNVKKCTKIVGNTDIALAGGVQQFYAPTGLGSIAIEPAYSAAGSVLATYTFEKVSGKSISKDDFALKVSNCDDANGEKASVTVRNTLPTEQPTQKPTEPTKPTEKPTEPTKPTQKPTDPTKPTQKPTDPTKPTQKPTEPTKPTQKPTNPTEKPTSTTATTVPSSTESTSASTVPAVSNGKCGDNAEWFFDETTGTLIISGSGDMWDYSAAEPEWVTKHGIYIKEVTISYGITGIGAGSFKNCLNLETVYIPSSVVRIGAGAFDGCYNLKNVYYEGAEEDFRNLFPQAESIFGSAANFNFDSSIVVDSDKYEDMTTTENDNEPATLFDKLNIDKNTLIIIIAVIVLLIIVACVLLVLKSKKKKAPAKEQNVNAEEEPLQYQDPNQYQQYQKYQDQNNDQNNQQ